MPPDPTNFEEMVHVALFMGDPLKSLEHAAQLDPWLSAHLADMMEPLSLVEKAVNEEYVTRYSYWKIGYRNCLQVRINCQRLLRAFLCTAPPL